MLYFSWVTFVRIFDLFIKVLKHLTLTNVRELPETEIILKAFKRYN